MILTVIVQYTLETRGILLNPIQVGGKLELTSRLEKLKGCNFCQGWRPHLYSNLQPFTLSYPAV